MNGHERVERAVVIQLLRSDRSWRWSREELEVELADISPVTVGKALALLHAQGVVRMAGETVWAAAATRRLDELGLIAI